MAFPSVTYTFVNATTASAAEVNTNFTDLVNGMSDGTKDMSINALTTAGAATFNGDMTLGNSSADLLTVTASLASTIPINTTNSYNIGSSTKGLAGIYFGANSQTVRIVGSASMSATYTFTLPVNAGTSGYILQTDGSGVTSWTSNFTSADDCRNVGLAVSVAANALTVALKGIDGNDPSSTNPVTISFRNATQATGTPTVLSVTSALSFVATAGSTLGTVSGVTERLYVYAINNAGTVVLGVSSGNNLDETLLTNTTSEGGAGAADTRYLLYTTNSVGALTSKGVRLIGCFESSQTVAGTWASAPTMISTLVPRRLIYKSQVRATGGSGHGSTNTRIRRFTTTEINTGNITFTQSAGNGDSFTIIEEGIYSFFYQDGRSGGTAKFGISVNSSQLTTNIQSITAADRVCRTDCQTAGDVVLISGFRRLKPGDVVRAHTDSTPDFTTDADVVFDIIKLTD